MAGKVPGKMLRDATVTTGKLLINANLPMGGNRLTGLGDGVDPADAVNKGQLDAISGGVPTLFNKNMPAEVADADGELACAEGMAVTPVDSCYVQVMVNGIQANLQGDLLGDCYFSNDGGTTPKAIAEIEACDLLYWNPTIAEFPLDADDLVDFNYNVVPGASSSSCAP